MDNYRISLINGDSIEVTGNHDAPTSETSEWLVFTMLNGRKATIRSEHIVAVIERDVD